MMRLFIGLGLSADVKDALWSAVSGLAIRGQLTPRENYHLTMAFLGDRDEKQATAVEPILSAAAKDCPPLVLEAKGFGFFGKRESALLYAKFAASRPLSALSGGLRRLLAGAGESFDDKPLAPHVTLARQADLTLVRLDAPLPPVSCTVHKLTLYHSLRVQGVLRYRPVFEAAFREENV